MNESQKARTLRELRAEYARRSEHEDPTELVSDWLAGRPKIREAFRDNPAAYHEAVSLAQAVIADHHQPK